MTMGRPKTKEDAFAIRRVTIELGTSRGVTLVIEMHGPSQTATVRSQWPTGEFRAAEHMSLETLLEQIATLAKAKETGK